MADQGGQWYKPSALKGSSSLAFLPLNLLLHSVEVQENTVRVTAAQDEQSRNDLFVEKMTRVKRQTAVRKALEAGSAAVDATWGWGITQFRGVFSGGRRGKSRRNLRRKT